MKLQVRPIEKKECIEFGVVCTCGLQLAFFYWGQVELIYAGVIISLLVLTVPRLLYPAAYVWNLFSALMQAVMPVVMLTAVFIFVVTPVAVLRRLFGGDSMRKREFGNGRGSVMEIRRRRFEPSDFKKMY